MTGDNDTNGMICPDCGVRVFCPKCEDRQERKCKNCGYVGAYLHSGMYECSRPDEDGQIENILDNQVLEHGYCGRWCPKR